MMWCVTVSGTREQVLFFNTKTIFISFTTRLRLQAEARGGERQPYFLGVPALSPSIASYSTLVDVWTDLDPLRATEIVDRMTSFGLAPAYQVSKV